MNIINPISSDITFNFDFNLDNNQNLNLENVSGSYISVSIDNLRDDNNSFILGNNKTETLDNNKNELFSLSNFDLTNNNNFNIPPPFSSFDSNNYSFSDSANNFNNLYTNRQSLIDRINLIDFKSPTVTEVNSQISDSRNHSFLSKDSNIDVKSYFSLNSLNSPHNKKTPINIDKFLNGFEAASPIPTNTTSLILPPILDLNLKEPSIDSKNNNSGSNSNEINSLSSFKSNFYLEPLFSFANDFTFDFANEIFGKDEIICPLLNSNLPIFNFDLTKEVEPSSMLFNIDDNSLSFEFDFGANLNQISEFNLDELSVYFQTSSFLNSSTHPTSSSCGLSSSLVSPTILSMPINALESSGFNFDFDFDFAQDSKLNDTTPHIDKILPQTTFTNIASNLPLTGTCSQNKRSLTDSPRFNTFSILTSARPPDIFTRNSTTLQTTDCSISHIDFTKNSKYSGLFELNSNNGSSFTSNLDGEYFTSPTNFSNNNSSFIASNLIASEIKDDDISGPTVGLISKILPTSRRQNINKWEFLEKKSKLDGTYNKRISFRQNSFHDNSNIEFKSQTNGESGDDLLIDHGRARRLTKDLITSGSFSTLDFGFRKVKFSSTYVPPKITPLKSLFKKDKITNKYEDQMRIKLKSENILVATEIEWFKLGVIVKLHSAKACGARNLVLSRDGSTLFIGKPNEQSSKHSMVLAEVENIQLGVTSEFAPVAHSWLCFSVFFNSGAILNIECPSISYVSKLFMSFQALAPLSPASLSRAKFLWGRVRLRVQYLAALNSVSVLEVCRKLYLSSKKPPKKPGRVLSPKSMSQNSFHRPNNKTTSTCPSSLGGLNKTVNFYSVSTQSKKKKK